MENGEVSSGGIVEPSRKTLQNVFAILACVAYKKRGGKQSGEREPARSAGPGHTGYNTGLRVMLARPRGGGALS